MVNVSQNEYIGMLSFVIPFQGHSEVKCAGSVDGNDVLGVKCVVEMVEVGTGGGADAEIIDYEGGRRGRRYLFSNTRTVGGGRRVVYW